MSVVRTGHWAFELSDTRRLLFQGDTGNTIDEFNQTTGTITPKGSLDFHASSSSLLAMGKSSFSGPMYLVFTIRRVPPALISLRSTKHPFLTVASSRAAAKVPSHFLATNKS